MSLAQKYRPKSFIEVVGQEDTKSIISRALQKDILSHALIFYGSRGTGKTTLARLIANSLVCLEPKEGILCGQCQMCKSAFENRLVDIVEIDAASHTSVENVRDLIEKMNFQPTIAKKKIYIIDEVHMLSRSAFNALLKTLEEPPLHVFFILATTELHKIPDTIQSRCQIFNFSKFSVNEIAGRLQEICEKEKIIFDREALLQIAQKALGGLRDAVSLLEQHSSNGEILAKDLSIKLGIAAKSLLNDFLQFIQKNEAEKAINLLEKIAGEGLSITNFAKDFLGFLRNEMLQALKNDQEKELNEFLQVIEIFSSAYEQLKDAVIPTLPLEVAVILSSQVFANKKDKFSWFSFSREEKKKPEKEEKIIKNENEVEIKKEIKKDPVFQAEEISLPNVKKLFPQVIAKLKNSALKMALKNSYPEKVEKNKIILALSSDAFKEKIDKNNLELAKAFEEIFGCNLKIDTKFSEISLQPVTSSSEEELDEENISEAIKEIFGEVKE